MEWKAEIGPAVPAVETNLSAVQRTWWSLGAFAETSTTLTWQHNELIVIS